MKVVLFHKNCQDGLFSAFSFWKKFGSKDVIFIEVNYKPIQDMSPLKALEYIFDGHIKNPSSFNTTKTSFEDNKVVIEDMREMELYVLDYSFPVEHLLAYIQMFKSILVLDHHKTAIDDYSKEFINCLKVGGFGWLFIRPSKNCEIVFSRNESGAKLTWMYFNGSMDVPDYIELVSDYDLWTFNLANSKKFHYGITLEEISNFNTMDALLNHHKHDIVNVGGKLERFQQLRNEKIAKTNTIDIIIKIAGDEYKAGLVNSFPDNRNDLCNGLISKGYDIGISYNISNSDEVSLSIRSRKGLDSSKVSVMYGGGGHAQSSACRISLEEFNKIIKNKHIIVVKKPSLGIFNRLLEIFK